MPENASVAAFKMSCANCIANTFEPLSTFWEAFTRKALEMLSSFRKLKKSVTNSFKRPNPQHREQSKDANTELDSLSPPYICPSPLPESSFEHLSGLEGLPRELLWQILVYAPQVVLDLRVTSRMLRHQVDVFAALEKTIPLACRIVLSQRPKSNSKLVRTPTQISLATNGVAANHAYRVLRTEGRGTPLGLALPKEIAAGCFGPLGRRHPTASRRVDLVSTTPLASRETREIGKEEDEKGFLLKLSTLVRSLCIVQRYPHGTLSPSQNRSIFWAHILIKMLSTNAKLDKLNILNQTTDAFLISRDAKILREKIPHLDKPIWFSATCDCYQKGIKYKENDYEIEGQGPLSRSAASCCIIERKAKEIGLLLLLLSARGI
ncbi:hypothetical protein PRIPAC_80322 [Pristionchus pacificus]|uniref:Uncharacterized protein n=1 Tax=Pristionchus pacificus TaxID=54126 RepID=A0A2A6BWU5_PRIPA|nr:hypothetical protein PRIPAC_80322 [Pristionchus pacificus]|eukprot:PDM70380.1 hypothetical protein PRIPAC_46626 [Pristionchus pacificus]